MKFNNNTPSILIEKIHLLKNEYLEKYLTDDNIDLYLKNNNEFFDQIKEILSKTDKNNLESLKNSQLDIEKLSLINTSLSVENLDRILVSRNDTFIKLKNLVKSFRYQLDLKAKRVRKVLAEEYKICSIIVNYAEDSVIASSIADGMNQVFRRSSEGNPTVEGVTARVLLTSCYTTVAPAAVSSFLADIVMLINETLSEDQQKELQENFTPVKKEFWNEYNLKNNQYLFTKKQKNARRFNLELTSYNESCNVPNELFKAPPLSLNLTPIGSDEKLFIFNKQEAATFIQKNSHYSNSFFIKNNIISYNDYISLLEIIYTKYDICLTYKMLDVLIAISNLNTDRFEITSSFPIAYIQLIVNKMDPVPLCKCLYEVLLAQNILKKTDFSSDGETYLKADESTVTETVGTDGKVKKRSKNSVFLPDKELYLHKYNSNLPMIYPPEDWVRHDSGRIHGGYYSTTPTSILKFNVLTTKDYLNFSLHLNKKLLHVLNRLQKIPFKVNEFFLEWVINNYKLLIEKKILAHPGFTLINFKELRLYIIKNCSYVKSDFYIIDQELESIKESIGKANAELLVLTIANTFKGFNIYTPSYCDWRGRIYRSGMLHVQGNKLSRNLLMWADPKVVNYCLKDVNTSLQEFFQRVGFSVTKHKSLKEAYDYGMNSFIKKISVCDSMEDPLEYASLALVKYPENLINSVGVTYTHMQLLCRKDASASAYQILGVLSGDTSIVKYCNVIPSDQIYDLYMEIYQNFIEWLCSDEVQRLVTDKTYIKERKFYRDTSFYSDSHVPILDELITLVKSEDSPFDRKLIKSLVMPFLYGITPYNAMLKVKSHLRSKNIHPHSNFLPYIFAKLLFIYIEKTYPSAFNFKKLLATIAKLASKFGIPIKWNIGDWSKVSQLYMKINKVKISTNSNILTKNNTSMNVKSSFFIDHKTGLPDSAKNMSGTPANVTHSLDSWILYRTISKFLDEDKFIGSIHDAFTTTWLDGKDVPIYYQESLLNILSNDIIINIFKNTFHPIFSTHESFKDKDILNCIYKLCSLNVMELDDIYNSPMFYYSQKHYLELKKHTEKRLKDLIINDFIPIEHLGTVEFLKDELININSKIKSLKSKLNEIHKLLREVKELVYDYNDVTVKKRNTMLKFLINEQVKNIYPKSVY